MSSSSEPGDGRNEVNVELMDYKIDPGGLGLQPSTMTTITTTTMTTNTQGPDNELATILFDTQ